MLHQHVFRYDESGAERSESERSVPGLGYAGRLLKLASRQILNQQKAVIEEQRFQALFQMLSLILHELNQPLTSLLGNIELMEFYKDKPDKLQENLNRINDAGKRMSSIIKKIQDVRNGAKIPHPNLLDLPLNKKKITVLALVNTEDNFSKISSIFIKDENIEIHRIFEEEAALSALEQGEGQLIIMDDEFLVLPGMRFLNHIKSRFCEIPMVFIVGENREILFFKAIQNGVESCLFENEITAPTILAAINNAMETAATKKHLISAIEKMANVSARDEVTGLFRDRFFRDAVDREIIRAKRSESSFSVCKVRIDDFNKIYDICGRDFTDQLVINLTQALQRNLDEKHMLCRYEKGAFAFLLFDDSHKKSQQIKEDLENLLRKNVSSQVSTSISIGSSLFSPAVSCSAVNLIKKAEAALKESQEVRGKSCASAIDQTEKDRVAISGH